MSQEPLRSDLAGSEPQSSSAPLLSVEHLTTSFRTDRGVLRAVADVSFRIPERSTVGLVGESGCGKSVTSLSILRLLPNPPAVIEAGQVVFRGRNLLDLSEREMCNLRGNDISMIFQEPMTSLNPVYTVGAQIVEAIRIHKRDVSRKGAWERTLELLRTVGIATPETTARTYPHELSGGQRQRIMIAMALSCEPKLLIADEPTTALDVTIQAQILALLESLKKRLGMSILLITHDLGVVAEHSDFIVVMYAGQVVEQGRTDAVFAQPLHPYTRSLMESLPRARGGNPERVRLRTIEGIVPDLLSLPPGCRFADRCPMAEPECSVSEPELTALHDERTTRCLLWQKMTA